MAIIGRSLNLNRLISEYSFWHLLTLYLPGALARGLSLAEKPLGQIPHPVHCRPGLDEFSLVLSPITVGFQEALDEIGPM